MEGIMEFDVIGISVRRLTEYLMVPIKVLAPVALLAVLYMTCIAQLNYRERGTTTTTDVCTSRSIPVEDVAEVPEPIYKQDFIYNPLSILSLGLPIGTITGDREEECMIEEPAMEYMIETQVVPSVIVGSTNEELIPKEQEKEEPKSSVVFPYVSLNSNGGYPDKMEFQAESDILDSGNFPVPGRLGKLFDGWYTDAACTIPFTGVEADIAFVSLYAGWIEFPGFLSNDTGMITGYTEPLLVARDGVLAFPSREGCVGVISSAISGLEGLVTEVYVPANITYLPEGIFDTFFQLMYIEVEAGNPAYYSELGVLYNIDGSLACSPAGRNYSFS